MKQFWSIHYKKLADVLPVFTEARATGFDTSSLRFIVEEVLLVWKQMYQRPLKTSTVSCSKKIIKAGSLALGRKASGNDSCYDP